MPLLLLLQLWVSGLKEKKSRGAWRTVCLTFPFVPLQPCCVVLYLSWWRTLFELRQGSQSPLFVCPGKLVGIGR